MIRERFAFDLQRFDEIINVTSNNTLISGTSGDDTISNGGWRGGYYHAGYSEVTIDAGDGSDSVESDGGSNVSINGGANNDTLRNYSSNATIDGGDDDDFIQNGILSEYGLYGGKYTSRGGENSNVFGGAGNDYIYNLSDFVTIDGGAGNDSIRSEGDDLTIAGATGDDTIFLDSESDAADNNSSENVLISYATGDGNDLIQGFNDSSTLQITSGSIDKMSSNDSDIFLTVGEGVITLESALGLSSINLADEFGNPIEFAVTDFNGTEDADQINNTLDGVTINALGGNDSILNSGSQVLINAGAGDDTILNKSGYPGTMESLVTETVQVEQPIYEKQTQTVSETIGYRDIYDDVVEPYTAYETKYRTKTRHITNYWGIGTTETYQEPYQVSVTKYRTVRKKVDEEPIVQEVTKEVDIQVGTKMVDSVVTHNVTLPVMIPTDNINTTVSGGAGDDYIVNEAANFVYVYANGDGNDTIYGFNEDSTLLIGDGTATYSSVMSGNDTIVTVGEGSIILVGAANDSADDTDADTDDDSYDDSADDSEDDSDDDSADDSYDDSADDSADDSGDDTADDSADDSDDDSEDDSGDDSEDDSGDDTADDSDNSEDDSVDDSVDDSEDDSVDDC